MDASILVGVTAGLAIGLVLLVLLGLILRWLWNSTLPDVLGVKPVTTWQAIKIMFIASMLFGGHRAVYAPPPSTEAPASVTQPTGNP